MPLPEGRQPLTDGDMIILLHNIAREYKKVGNEYLGDELRETADRLTELSEKEKNNAFTNSK